MKFSQRYIADLNGVACNSRLPQAKGGQKGNKLPYLNPFGKLVKGNGAPHAKFSQIACGIYSIIFWKFAQITFGAVAKGNSLPFGV
jgi:hypothetical protein